MEAKVLRHKSLDGRHGIIVQGVLYTSGDHIVPQLFPATATVEWLLESINKRDREAAKNMIANDFELVPVIWRYFK